MAPEANVPNVGYGGPKGGGKSYGARAIAFGLTYSLPIQIVIVRSRLKTLQRNHIMPAQNELRQFIKGGKINFKSQHNMFVMPSGGLVYFMQCETEADVGQFDGVGADLYILDEAGHFTKSMIDGIVKNNRTSDIAMERNVDYNPRTLYTFNWGGPGHSTLKRWFWDRIFEEGEQPEDYSKLIFASIKSNKELIKRNPQYIRRLASMPTQLRRAYLLGDPDAFIGSMFTVVHQYHEVEPNQVLGEYGGKVPDHWMLYGSLDPGTRVCSFGLYAIDPEGYKYKIKHYYGKEMNAPTHIRNIDSMVRSCPYTDGRLPSVIFSDSWAFGQHERHGFKSNDITWADQLATYGYYCSQIKFGRVAAIMGLQSAIHFDVSPEDDEELLVTPKLRFFKGECGTTLEEMKAAERDDNNPEDISKNSIDHAIDETKNLIMGAIDPPEDIPAHQPKPVDKEADHGSEIDPIEESRKAMMAENNWENLF